jgi:2-oxoisovalerate ferredoxin oxidoreductase gamma subunit
LPQRILEIRWHGRGGQGAVTAAMILAKAAISEGRWAQAFPAFGPERRGAPVLAFTRISDSPITIRSEIYQPDVIVILDPTLPKTIDVKSGFKEDGTAIFNSTKKPSDIKNELNIFGKVATVDATKIAIETLGKPISNTAILGAFVKAVSIVKIDSIIDATKEVFPGDVDGKNANAIKRSYEETDVED